MAQGFRGQQGQSQGRSLLRAPNPQPPSRGGRASRRALREVSRAARLEGLQALRTRVRRQAAGPPASRAPMSLVLQRALQAPRTESSLSGARPPHTNMSAGYLYAYASVTSTMDFLMHGHCGSSSMAKLM